mmetsp:Transcript_87539/g.252429  ORF Transcript_87539/g.252429 Transcript_87539/m.252429 type:complete len:230 (+) Transcript_87539:273-962(+)
MQRDVAQRDRLRPGRRFALQQFFVRGPRGRRRRAAPYRLAAVDARGRRPHPLVGREAIAVSLLPPSGPAGLGHLPGLPPCLPDVRRGELQRRQHAGGRGGPGEDPRPAAFLLHHRPLHPLPPHPHPLLLRPPLRQLDCRLRLFHLPRPPVCAGLPRAGARERDYRHQRCGEARHLSEVPDHDFVRRRRQHRHPHRRLGRPSDPRRHGGAGPRRPRVLAGVHMPRRRPLL